GEIILEAQAFVSKLNFGSFGRYALSQLDKLSSTQRLAQHRDLVLEWLSEGPARLLAIKRGEVLDPTPTLLGFRGPAVPNAQPRRVFDGRRRGPEKTSVGSAPEHGSQKCTSVY
ncbi:MAG: hypothetical protein ACYC8T_02415, partial [Myxococcaceae bacterium]